MSTLSTEDTTRQSTVDAYPDAVLNPVVEVADTSWQRLLTQSAWTPHRLHLRTLPAGTLTALGRGGAQRGRGQAAWP